MIVILKGENIYVNLGLYLIFKVVRLRVSDVVGSGGTLLNPIPQSIDNLGHATWTQTLKDEKEIIQCYEIY